MNTLALLQSVSPMVPRRPVAVARSRKSCGRILVAAGDHALGQALSTHIARRSFEPVVVATAEAAREELNGVGPRETPSAGPAWAAVILDEQLQDGSGIELLSRVNGALCGVPTLIVAGSLNDEIVKVTFDLDAKYMTRPFDEAKVECFLRHVYLRSFATFSSPERLSLGRMSWEYVRWVVATSPTKRQAADTLGVAPRSLRRMLAKSPPPR